MFVFGAGGHGRVVLAIARDLGVAVRGFVDRDRDLPASVAGVPVFASLEAVPRGSEVVVAIGDNDARRAVAEEVAAARPDLAFARLVHPAATVMAGAAIGRGSVVMPNATVGAGAAVGEHCIVNTGAVLEHDSRLADFASLGPRAATGGRVRIGEGAFVGIGAVLKHGVAIGAGTVVGAASYVHRDVPETRVVVFGAPARVVRRRAAGEFVLQ